MGHLINFIFATLLLSGCISVPTQNSSMRGSPENVAPEPEISWDRKRDPAGLTENLPTFLKGYSAYSDKELALEILRDGTLRKLECEQGLPKSLEGQAMQYFVKVEFSYSQTQPPVLLAQNAFVNGALFCRIKNVNGELIGQPVSERVTSCKTDPRVKVIEECCKRQDRCTSVVNQ